PLTGEVAVDDGAERGVDRLVEAVGHLQMSGHRVRERLVVDCRGRDIGVGEQCPRSARAACDRALRAHLVVGGTGIASTPRSPRGPIPQGSHAAFLAHASGRSRPRPSAQSTGQTRGPWSVVSSTEVWMCSRSSSMTVMPSVTPPFEPGKLMTKVRPRTPATPRLITAEAVASRPLRHIA